MNPNKNLKCKEIKVTWQSALDAHPTGQLQAWLNDVGSFMQRLAQHHIDDAVINVLRQAWLQPADWECELLQLKQDDEALVREVGIMSNTSIWMYARTVFPKEILAGKQELSCLENRSLGSVLFQDPNIKRGNLEFIYAKPRDLWRDFLPCEQVSWTRRSLFTLQQQSLLLTELFMPDLEKLCMKN